MPGSSEGNGLDRRQFVAATLATATAAPSLAIDRGEDFTLRLDGGWLSVQPLGQDAVRVRYSREAGGARPSQMLVPQAARPRFRRSDRNGDVVLALPGIRCRLERATGHLSFYDGAGRLLLETAERRLEKVPLGTGGAWFAEQAFVGPADERLFGSGQFQDGFLNLKGLSRRLTQVNTQVSLPFFLSSRGYGLLWHNEGMTELNPLDQLLVLTKNAEAGGEQTVTVTTAEGSRQERRKGAVFEGRLTIEQGGRHALMLDIGSAMASQYYVEIDGRVLVDFANLWLPPTTSLFADLAAGEHHVRVICRDRDAPKLYYCPVRTETVLRSPVADAIDYVVIAGASGADVIAAYRRLTGAVPMLPRWAFGYIHCRERFRSQEELLATAREFRRRGLPIDVIVQDWQYWGKHGWNAMRFDETAYPDPKTMIDQLHAMDMRFMLSVWAKVDRKSELGKAMAARGFYIEDTDWVDFFNPEAARFYWQAEKKGLLDLGVDCFWQDATEPENDDLHGRITAAGPGDRVRNIFPLQITRTVYEGQRSAAPNKRVVTLTRSAAPGQQRYASAVWSGDIGNDWETLRRQICAGLNFVAAGQPYWTVDAGGFFRPGPGQYTDAAYHERFLRWFQYATFLPLQRVHGYQTDTEFWRYGEQVEQVARRYLELRYRLLPYIYSTAAEVTRRGASLMRPLVMDFADDPAALDQKYAYMFGPALHVAPVCEAAVSRWKVYLPRAAGGWHDFWTGRRRAGGTDHVVDAPTDRIPLHVRAGTILPLAEPAQSTAGAHGRTLELRVYPGADGSFSLHEDDGLSYDYEKGAFSRIGFSWDDRTRTLSISARNGAYPGMPSRRRFLIRVMDGPSGEGVAAVNIAYDGRPAAVRLPPAAVPAA